MGKEMVMFMHFGIKGFQTVLFAAFSVQILQASPTIAQVMTPPPIIPVNGTGTEVLPNGNQIDINGGVRIDNNLFHNFREFNVPAGNNVIFHVSPQIENVLNGVSGGNPSVINGSINMPNSNANFYLLNPAGIVFGNGAQVNVNSAFTAATARTVNFGDRSFDVLNPNYANLSGSVTGFEFDLNSNAAIVNAGNLNGKSVTLAAPTVVNTGNISAPNGGVNIVAIPGDRLRLNLGEPGLYYEVAIPRDAQGNAVPFKGSDLPSLLTTGKLENTGISLNSQGQAQLTDSQTAIPNLAGTAIVGGNISVAAPVASAVLSRIQISGDRVGLVGASLDASGLNGGGSVFIGGDFQGKGIIPNALMTFVSADSTIKADALQLGNGGRVIVWADNATRFFGSVSARGGVVSGDGGFVEISGKENLVFDGQADLSAPNGKGGTLLLDPTNITIANNVADTAGVPAALPDIFASEFPNQSINISQATLEALSGNTNVLIEATNNITIGTLNLVEIDAGTPSPTLTFQQGTGTIRFTAGGSFTMTANSFLQARGRDIAITAGSIDVGTILARTFANEGNAGNVTLTTTGDITVRGQGIDVVSLSVVGQPGGNAGNIVIDAGGNFTVEGLLRAFSQTDNGGNLFVKAGGNILFNCSVRVAGVCGVETFTEGNITPASVPRNSGNINITSVNGGISLLRTTGLNAGSSSDGKTGDVNLTAKRDIILESGFISSQLEFDNNRTSGNISITSTEGNVSASGLISSASANANAGTVSINAFGNININSIATLGENAGKISIESAGNVAIDGLLRAFSPTGNGADVSVKANNGNILFSCAFPLGVKCGVETFPQNTAITVDTLRAGNIELLSPNGSITMQGNSLLDAGADSQNSPNQSNANRLSGSVTITAKGDIVTGTGGIATDISYNNGLDASKISITSTEGNITVFNLNSSSFSGRGGDVILSAKNGAIGAYFVQQTPIIPFEQAIVTGFDASPAAGNITFDGKVILDPSLNPNLDPATISKIFPEIILNTRSIGGGNITFTDTVDGANKLNIFANQATVTFQNTIGGTTPITGLNIAATNTNLNGNVTTANSPITFSSPVTLNSPTVFNAGTDGIAFNNGLSAGNNPVSLIADNITLANAIAGTNTLSIKPSTTNRNIVLGGTDATALNLTSAEIATITGFSQVSIDNSAGTGSIAFTAPVTFNAPTTLLSGTGSTLINASITTTGQNLTFSNAILGADVALNTTGGNVLFNGTLNGTQDLTINTGTGNTTFNGTIGATNPLRNLAITGQNITFNETLTTASNGNVTITNTGNLTIAKGLTLDGSFTQNGTGNSTLTNGISTTNDNITFTSPLTLNGLINFTIGNANFSFGALNIGVNPLTLAANEIDFTGGANSVTGTNRLILQPNTASQDLNIGGAIATTALDITATDLAALGNGFSQVQLGRTDGTGTINIIGTANFQDPATIVTMGTTNINAPIVGNDNASLNVTATNINLNANLSSNGQAIALNGNTRLITNPTISSTNGNISTNGTIDSQAGTNLSLALNAGTGNLNLNGAVGNSDRLSNIDLSAANISISGGINTVNSLQISNPITITGTSTFSNLIGDININAAIAIQAGTSANVTISAATGNVNTQNIDLSLPAAAGNSIALRSPQGIITTGDLNVSGTSGGNINIQALTAITTGRLSARGTAGNGGVIVLDPLLDIVAGAIDAQGFGGVGGTVDLTTNRFARIIGVVVDQNGQLASITTAGTAGDGVIIIRHDGGTRFEPFNVFSSLINGTDGVLTTGAGNTIFTPQSFPGPYTQGNIQIITAANFTIFLAGETLNGPPEVRWTDEGDRSPFPPEEFYTRQFADFFKQTGIPDFQSPKAMTLAEVQETLRRVQSETGVNPALLYVTFMPDRMDARKIDRTSQDECLNPPSKPNAISPSLPDLEITKLPDSCDILELTLVTANGKPTYIPVRDKDSGYIRRRNIDNLVDLFKGGISTPPSDPSEDTTGLSSISKKLYSLLVDHQRMQSALKASKINNLTFILPENLRQIPFAALRDQQDLYIIEKYSVGMMPSLSLTDTRRSVLYDKKLLALGASKFSEIVNKSELPFVEIELTQITNNWNSNYKLFLNDEFTEDKLYNTNNASIIHIATHATFDDQKGVGNIALKNSFVSLNKMRSFNWKNIPVELLVLSACQTSVGNSEYELGFAGVAVRANVKSAIGSLWQAKDLSTSELMANFYLELRNDRTVIKADALKKAQIRMLKSPTNQDFKHPYYWSTFTLIGNPW
jgi:filamentous hemagglutinin family protein